MFRKFVHFVLSMVAWFVCIFVIFLTTAIVQGKFSLSQFDQLLLFLAGMFVGVLAWELALRRPITGAIRDLGPRNDRYEGL